MPKMLVVVNDDDGSQGDSPAIPSIVVPFDIDSIHALGGIARAERLRDWERLRDEQRMKEKKAADLFYKKEYYRRNKKRCMANNKTCKRRHYYNIVAACRALSLLLDNSA
jgi:hypothetical protein